MSTRKLNDKTWTKIYSFLKQTPGTYTGDEANSRQFIEAVYWIMRTGAPWRDLPEKYGNWNSVYKRFSRWADKKIWQRMQEYFTDEPDMEWLMLDSTVVRAHPCAAGALKKNGGQAAQALGYSRGGFSTKIHTTVDALGNPVRFYLTGGQAHDAPRAKILLERFDFEAVIADRAYDSADLIEYIENQGALAVIPPRKNRTESRETDWSLYKARHLVECFINKIKHYRRIFSRFEKYDSRYMAFLHFAASLIWLK